MIRLLPCDGHADIEPHFFSTPDADALFDALMTSLAWATEDIVMFGKTIRCPRLTAWYGEPGTAYRYSGIKHVAQGWPPPLAAIRAALGPMHTPWNSVLCNLYRDGQDAMGWHRDAEAALGPNPSIASLSFGAARRFELRHRTTKQKVAVELPHGSLLLMHGETQAHWQHRLPRTRHEVGPRINLTFRRIVQPSSDVVS